ncbi:ribosome biogenesis GTPase YqeH [Paenibacillus senegalensis]|uniref:ribosome biogenesis GTPase YqeH n=1 Tax=Paenibacillus senegalensis TaxID=1465766 RepID=UPI00028895D7|nr:ribosome biogenesis GTPase YqeH [Paenibacillus senegalensis]
MEEELQCEGCGVHLQMDDPSALGYVPEQALLKIPVICQRCFRIKHYNEMTSETPNQDDFLRMLGHIAHTRSLVIHIIDVFDFEGSLISGLQRFIGSNPVLLVVNKMDLLPKVTNWNKVVNWVQKQAKDNGLKVADVALCSAKKGIGFDTLLKKLDSLRQGRDVYVVGATNAGKSTLINRLIKDYSDLESELTTSHYPGTTLNMVRIPLDDGKAIIDTPGIVYKHRLSEVVPKPLLSTLLPDKPIKPVVYQLNEKQTLFFGSLVRFDFARGERQSFTCYTSNRIPVHRTKLERADELYAQHKGEMLAPPTLDQLEHIPHWTRVPVSIRKGQEAEILISGLGWIKANGTQGAEVVIHAPEGTKIAVRKSLI